MRRIRPMRSLGPAALAALATVLVVATPGGAAPTPSQVVVTNTAANPVPVTQQGTASVNVTNSSLPVTQQGTANVNVTNSSLPVQVQGTVDVNESPTAPVSTREAPVLYGDTMILIADGDDGRVCQDIDLADGRAVRLESMIVYGFNRFSPDVPRVWIQTFGEVTPPNSVSVGIEIPIPLREEQGDVNNALYWSGQLLTGFPIIGGPEHPADGKLGNVRACIQAAPSNTSTARINFSGVYLDG